MHVHWLQHAEHEDLGCIAPWLAARGAQVSMTRLHAGEPPPTTPDFDALIVMGGPMNIYEHESHPWLVPEKELIRSAIDADRRVLGICLGSQLIADVLGGPVSRNAHTEVGWFEVSLNAEGRVHPWFADWPERFEAFHWHSDTFAIPRGAQNLMASEACAHQGFVYGDRIVGLQFHLEVTAADARVWFQHEQPAAERYVQTPDFILERIERFGLDNRLMLRLLDRFFPADA
ncbi:MAG: type 1 glutamine amidotransferase [Panacagrimonas sp.]